MSRPRTAINSRKGIKISEETRKLYEQRDKSLDDDPDTRSLPPEKWAHAMRREEFFLMKPEYDFSKGKRGRILPAQPEPPGKTTVQYSAKQVKAMRRRGLDKTSPDAPEAESLGPDFWKNARPVMRMHNPPHPGKVLNTALDGLPMNVTDFAAHIGVSRQTVHRILNGSRAITADISIRLAEALGQPTLDIWLKMQMDYDSWQASQAKRKKIKPVAAVLTRQREAARKLAALGGTMPRLKPIPRRRLPARKAKPQGK